MTIQLPQEVEESVLAEVRSGHFASADDALTEAWWVFLRQREETSSPSSSSVLDDRRRQNLERLCEQLDAMPAAPVRDALTNRDHDQILYGR
jgi:Arc/MetJ-type ribon-helix-helix transcriptional regulator